MREKRFFSQTGKLNIRAEQDKQGQSTEYFEGYAIVFGKRSVLINDWAGKYFEIITRSAVENYLASGKEIDIVLSFNHNINEPLARFKSNREFNNLELSVDDTGLFVRAEIGNTTLAKDVKEMIARGDVEGMSFIFTITPNGDSFEETETEIVRTINEIENIYDVSIVTYPAYKDTDIAVAKRAIEKIKEEKQENFDNSIKQSELELLKLKIF